LMIHSVVRPAEKKPFFGFYPKKGESTYTL
jgi:hypothetical protein